MIKATVNVKTIKNCKYIKQEKQYIKLSDVMGVLDKITKHCTSKIKEVKDAWKESGLKFCPNMEESQYQDVIDYVADLKEQLESKGE